MRPICTPTNGPANESAVRAGIEIAATAHADSDDENWFGKLAQQLLCGTDAGFALNLLTGVPERSCYRYASGERDPTGWFVRQLLRSEQGQTWLNAIMDGSDVRWWREQQLAAKLHALLKPFLQS